MRNKREKTLIVTIATAFLSIFSLFSIGFASWTAIGGDDVKQQGEVAAEAFIPLIEGVSVSARSKFTASHYQFENNEGYSDEGDLSFDFAINENELTQEFVRNNVLELMVVLTFEDNLPLFKPLYIPDENITSTNSAIESISRDENYSELTVYLSIQLYGIGSTIHVYLTYSFTNEMVAKYYQQIDGKHFIIRVAGTEVQV